MAHQEKLHFCVATDGQLDRFDGVPDTSYLEDIKAHMTKIFAAWDQRPEAYNWLQLNSPQHASDFQKKFPFAVERLNQRCFRRQDFDKKHRVKGGAVKHWNTPSEQNRPALVGTRSVTATSRPIRQDPRRSREELQMAQVTINILFIRDNTIYYILYI